jgi:hypothetical protein
MAQLKQQLREQLAAVEAREKIVLESMRPTTAAEIDLVQRYLQAALDELKSTPPQGSAPAKGEGT